MITLNKNIQQIVVGGTKYTINDNCVCEISHSGFGGYHAYGDDTCARECAALARKQMRNAAIYCCLGAVLVWAGIYTMRSPSSKL